MRRVPALVALAALLGGTAASDARAAMPEYALKAQILVELLSYVQWPVGVDPDGRAFDIVVVGKSPFGTYLDDYARTRTFHQRPIRVRYLAKGGDLSPCSLVFLCRSEGGRVDAVSAWARHHHVLTVADDEALLRRDVMVHLVMERNYVRLAVNPDSVSAAGLTLSSRLLRNARILPSSHAAS